MCIRDSFRINRQCSVNWSKIADGGGRITSGTLAQTTAACQITRTIAANPIGSRMLPAPDARYAKPRRRSAKDWR